MKKLIAEITIKDSSTINLTILEPNGAVASKISENYFGGEADNLSAAKTVCHGQLRLNWQIPINREILQSLNLTESNWESGAERELKQIFQFLESKGYQYSDTKSSASLNNGFLFTKSVWDETKNGFDAELRVTAKFYQVADCYFYSVESCCYRNGNREEQTTPNQLNLKDKLDKMTGIELVQNLSNLEKKHTDFIELQQKLADPDYILEKNKSKFAEIREALELIEQSKQ